MPGKILDLRGFLSHLFCKLHERRQSETSSISEQPSARCYHTREKDFYSREDDTADRIILRQTSTSSSTALIGGGDMLDRFRDIEKQISVDSVLDYEDEEEEEEKMGGVNCSNKPGPGAGVNKRPSYNNAVTVGDRLLPPQRRASVAGPATAVTVEDDEVTVVKKATNKRLTWHGVSSAFPRRYSVVNKSGVPRRRSAVSFRFAPKKHRRRVILKNGDCNVQLDKISNQRSRYLADFFTTLVDAQWRYTLGVFACSFVLSWLAFAFVWYLIAYNHGDLNPARAADWNPCVREIDGFASSFLFSVETQHTIGYGFRHTTDQCAEAIFIMCLQSLVGVMIQAFMVGMVFAKLSRPKKRAQTLLFSKKACICQRDGQLALLMRVGDMRKSHIIEAHVRVQVIRRRVTAEGEVIPYDQRELNVGYDTGEDRLFFIWPTTIVHIIDENSPFYNLSAADLMHSKFEVVVILEGIIESTGMTTQARTSYLPNEILWGHRFSNIVTFNKHTGSYCVDYSKFHDIYEIDTPLCSMKELDEFNRMNDDHADDAAETPVPSISSASPNPASTISRVYHDLEDDTKALIVNNNLSPPSTIPHIKEKP